MFLANTQTRSFSTNMPGGPAKAYLNAFPWNRTGNSFCVPCSSVLFVSQHNLLFNKGLVPAVMVGQYYLNFIIACFILI